MKHQATAKINSPGGAVTELVTRAGLGDREAFATLYNEHQATVFRFLVRRTGDRLLAEDLTSETFLRALRRIDTFAERSASGGFGGWLCTIARNLHTDHFRSARVQREVLVDSLPDSDVRDRSAEATALHEMGLAETAETVTAAMATLTPYQRECVRLRFFEDLSVPETAARLGKGLGATKTLQFRAVQEMRAVLAAEAVAA